MKKMKKLFAALSVTSATLVATPMVMIATSCNKSSNKFAGEDVSKGDFIPSYSPRVSTSDIFFSEGNELYLDALTKRDINPKEEYKWFNSQIAGFLPMLGSYIQMLTGQETPAIVVNKYQTKLSNFRFGNKHRATYTVTSDISLGIDLDFTNSESKPKRFTKIKGNVRLGWKNDVVNTPIGLFDFDPSNVIGGQIFEDSTIWYVSPDLSQLKANDTTWHINYDYLIGANISFDNNKLINIPQHEIYFYLNSKTAGDIEELIDDNKRAYFIERVIGLLSGWGSYWLTQTQQKNHFDADPEWTAYFDKNDDDENGVPTITSSVLGTKYPAQHSDTAKLTYKLADEHDYLLTSEELGVEMMGGSYYKDTKIVDPDSYDYFGSAPVKGEITNDDVFSDGHVDVNVDWRDEARPAGGWGLSDINNKMDFVIPVFYTKDWVSIGKPFELVESKDVSEDTTLYPEHQDPHNLKLHVINDGVSPDGKVTMKLNVTSDYATLSGGIISIDAPSYDTEDKPGDDWEKMNVNVGIETISGGQMSIPLEWTAFQATMHTNYDCDGTSPYNQTRNFNIRIKNNNTESFTQIGPFAIQLPDEIGWKPESKIISFGGETQATINDAFSYQSDDGEEKPLSYVKDVANVSFLTNDGDTIEDISAEFDKSAADQLNLIVHCDDISSFTDTYKIKVEWHDEGNAGRYHSYIFDGFSFTA